MPYLTLNKLQRFPSLITLNKPHQNKTFFTDSKTTIGIELEIENVFGGFEDRYGSVGDYWNVTEDGSLRNGGLEFVSFPVYGNHIPAAVNYLLQAIEEYAPDAQCSHRCGIHVHINARDLNPIQVLSWMVLALLYERTLFRMSGNRNKNIFCVPLEDWYENLKNAFLLLSTEDNFSIFLELARGHKYSNINCKPLFEHGTIEFRSMKTTRNAADILSWAAILISIKEFVENIDTPDKFIEYLTKLCTLKSDSDFQQLNREVFGDKEPIINQFYSAKDLKGTLSIVKELACIYKNSINTKKEVKIQDAATMTSEIFDEAGQRGIIGHARPWSNEEHEALVNSLNSERLRGLRRSSFTELLQAEARQLQEEATRPTTTSITLDEYFNTTQINWPTNS